jgi:hypothetical protein
MNVAAGLEGIDAGSLLRGAAVLALWPPNADRHAALNALVDHVAATVDPGGLSLSTVDARPWRDWLAAPASTSLRSIQPDGLHDAPLFATTALLGRPVALLAGDLEAPDLHFRLHMECLADMLATTTDPALEQSLQLLATAAELSDLVVRRAELVRHPWPDHDHHHAIGVPDDRSFQRLAAALTFSVEDLRQREWIDAASLATLTRPSADGAACRPLVATADGTLLVADPWRLTEAALRHACEALSRSDGRLELIARLTEASLAIVSEAAHDMDWSTRRIDGSSILADADVDCRVLLSVFAVPFDAGATRDHVLDAPPSFDAAYERTESLGEALSADHALMVVLGDGRPITIPVRHPAVHGAPSGSVVVTGLPELRLIADGLRRDPLALLSALERLPPRPWPESMDLADLVGIARRLEEPLHHQRELPADGTEHLRLRGEMMAARHAAPGPDGTGWVEVTRWGRTANNAIFSVPERQEIELAVRSSDGAFWVRPREATTDPYALVSVIAQIFALWLARLRQTGWPRTGRRTGQSVVLRFSVEVDARIGPALGMAWSADGSTARVIAGPGFVHQLCRGDNDADRMLLAAAIAHLGDRLPDEQARLLDEVAPPGTGTLVIWPAPDITTDPPRLEVPPLVGGRDRELIARELATMLVPEDDVVVVQKEQVEPVLKIVVDALETRVADQVAALTGDSLRELVLLHERCAVQSTNEAIHLPARSAVEDADLHLGRTESSHARDVALRALIERTAAAPPTGEHPLSMRRSGRLRAAVELQIELGAVSDAARTGTAEIRVVIGWLLGVIVTTDGDLAQAGGAMQRQVELAAPDRMLAVHDAWWTDAPVMESTPRLDRPIALDDKAWDGLDQAFAATYDVSFEQLIRLLRVLRKLADEAPDAVATLTPAEVHRRLVETTAIADGVVTAAIGLLTLGPCDDYDVRARHHAPWKHNRERSYLRRPLVQLPDGRLAWSAQHLTDCSKYLIGLIRGGRLEGARPLRRAVVRISQQEDREFEDVVGRHVEETGWRALVRVRHLSGVPLQRRRGEAIGDIDVLAWSAERRRVWLLEAKRLAPGLQPYAMVRQSWSLADTQTHHLERLAWVRGHREQLATTVGHDITDWTVEAAIVLDHPLAGAHLGRLTLPVWTLWELPGKLGSAG